MTIIADSGSTKTTWACYDNQSAATHQSILATSLGINPIRDSKETITEAVSRGYNLLQQEWIKSHETTLEREEVREIYFYGAGCIPPYSDSLKEVLQAQYPHARILVESDMMGAALALCGHHEGIACILGTGSNSCLFDGEKIVAQTPALGFILGDEGSGASLGKRLVGDILKRQLPEEIQQAFFNETGLTQAEVINRVYRQPQPNMFLASLTPFLARHKDHAAVKALLVEEFRRFLQRNIRNYQRPELPIHFVGGITVPFEAELQQAIEMEGMKKGQIISAPITGMVAYYQS